MPVITTADWASASISRKSGRRSEYSPSLHLALRIAAYFDVAVDVVFAIEPFKRLGD